jgi:glycosyltransferase involved in cell wall biosynthesis
MSFLLIRRRVRTLFHYARSYGVMAALQYAVARLTVAPLRGLGLQAGNVVECYKFVTLPVAKTSLTPKDVSKKTVNWFIPPVGKGSGGHLNIFRFISNLEKLGYECRIVIVGQGKRLSADQAKREIDDWFFPLKAEVFVDAGVVPPAYISMATEWRTAYWVRSITNTAHRCYFVQDFEPSFFPMGSEYVFAEETYRFGFIGITAGNWLQKKLASEYGMKTYSVGFSYDKGLYRYIPRNFPVHPKFKRVLFYARPPTPRRAFELGLLVLNEVAKRNPEVEVILAGWDLSGYSIPFNHRSAGLLSLSELPTLYSECDVALVISLTNLSLLPLELMACGVPIVSNRAPCTEWLLNERNARMAVPAVAGLADAICEVLENPDEASRLVKGGLETVATTDWEIEASKMAAILDAL